MTRLARRRPRIGLRREVVILLPVALFLLVLLSVFTLFAYRSGVSLLVEERRGEALLLAQRVAGEAAAGPVSSQDLRRLAPTARGIVVLDAAGRTVARSGDVPEGGVLAPLTALHREGTVPREPRALGPGRDVGLGDAVAAFVPLAGPAGAVGEAGWARVDLRASALGVQRRGLRVLTWLVLGVDAALVVLVILFLGRLLAPWDTLLERARRAGETPPEAEDEVAFLVGTFERALEALARPPDPEKDSVEGGDIAVLQRALATSFESGVLLLDRRGGVLTVNPAGAQILEVEPLEVEPLEAGAGAGDAGRPLSEALADHPALARLLAEAVTTGRGVRRREIGTTTPSGRRLALGLTVHPLRAPAPGDDDRGGGDAGGPAGFLVLFADLTEVRQRTEQARLAESLQQIGELAAGVAHELRNSLATLKGYLTLIERTERTERTVGGGDRRAVTEYVDEVRRETDHLQRVLEDFLSFARPGTVRLERVDLHRVLARAAADPVLAGARVRLSAPADSPAPPGAGRGLSLSGDPQLLERAFRNLLHNAVQAAREAGSATEGGPEVEVAASATPEGLEVTVADRGPGIPEEVKERLFQPFASARPGGVGLGLALARRIVVLHGGTLELEDRPGGGSVARVRLPPGGAEGQLPGGPDLPE